MKVNIEKQFWSNARWYAKPILILGFYLVDLGMRLNGMETNEQTK